MSSVQKGSPPPSADVSASLSDAEAAFRQAYPAYATTHLLDELRATEYARLDRAGHIYLDYTGGGLFPASQVGAPPQLLLGKGFRKPPPRKPHSPPLTALVGQARAPALG